MQVSVTEVLVVWLLVSWTPWPVMVWLGLDMASDMSMAYLEKIENMFICGSFDLVFRIPLNLNSF